MKTSFQLKALPFFLCAFLVSSLAFGQGDGKTMPSPRDSVMGKVAGSNIKIWYGAPSVKGRTIFGGLEPWDKVYRAGANEATQFTTSKDIKVEGKTLPARVNPPKGDDGVQQVLRPEPGRTPGIAPGKPSPA